MMTSPIGARRSDEARVRAGFTLIELIVVMTLLMVVLGVGFPTLKRFFQGRSLDAEARRLWSLTAYGQSRAISEGVPMVLWIDEKQRRYGLEMQTGYQENDTRAVEYELDKDLEMTVMVAVPTTRASWQPTLRGRGQLPMIRFLPDGSFGTGSPNEILLRDASTEAIGIVRQTNHMRYAIENVPAR